MMQRRVALVALLLGCEGPTSDEAARGSPLIRSPQTDARPIDVERAAHEPEELLRALQAPAAALGSHRVRGTSRIRVRAENTEVDTLDEQTSIDWGADGWHAVYTNSRDYGREAFFDGERLWLRPRYGKFHRRAPTSPEEPARIVADVGGALAATFDLVAASARLQDRGVVDHAGRPARQIAIAAGQRRTRAPHAAPEKKWRDETAVRSLEGEVVLDRATGVPLAATLRAEVAFVREGRSFTMSIETTHAAVDVGAAIAIATPSDADSVDTPARSTEFEDREALLTGIAPPASKAPTPAAKQDRP